jgi:putative Mg2+ transporter-C (MgtC) family protein
MTLYDTFWSPAILHSNGLIFLDILGAMGLGLILGFERNFHGHAAGMRTYALVSGSAAAVTAIGGFSGQWFGGPEIVQGHVVAEATHVIQGIVTGIGFLGAGVILRDGATIRGLSTAASIWTTAAIGIIVGVGFYSAAILTTLMTVALMIGFKRVEMRMPHRRQFKASITLSRPEALPFVDVDQFMRKFGFTVGDYSCQNDKGQKHVCYEMVLHSDATHNFNELLNALDRMESVSAYNLSPMRD